MYAAITHFILTANVTAGIDHCLHYVAKEKFEISWPKFSMEIEHQYTVAVTSRTWNTNSN